MMRTAAAALCLLLAGSAAAAAQQAGPGLPADALRIALATEDYPVTPGDAYTLTWWQADVLETATLVVASDGTVDMGIFGTVNAAGLTYARLKPLVSERVAAMYSRGSPSLILAAPGEFRVRVSGEVAATTYVPAWGLSRLSEIVAAAALPTSWLRNVEVLDRLGRSNRFDLFAAARQGTPSQDPLVHPGDSIVLDRAPVVVRISGEVRRPGVYQPDPGDTLSTLVDTYGGGLTPGADAAHVAVDGFSGGSTTRIIDLSSSAAGATPLADGDTIRVPSLAQSLPLVYIEGAVTGTAAIPAAPGGTDGPGAQRLALRLRAGETLRDAVLEAWDSLSPLADLGAASLVRGNGSGSRSIDLRATLAGKDPASDPALGPFDRIVIPSVQPGAVTVPAAASSSSSSAWFPAASSFLALVASLATLILVASRGGHI